MNFANRAKLVNPIPIIDVASKDSPNTIKSIPNENTIPKYRRGRISEAFFK